MYGKQTSPYEEEHTFDMIYIIIRLLYCPHNVLKIFQLISQFYVTINNLSKLDLAYI